MTNNADAAQLEFMNSMFATTIPSAHSLGVRVVEVRRGFAATTAPISGNGNHFGVMYAGVLFTVAEVLGGLIAIPAFDQAKFYPLVKDLKITYKRPALSDVRAETSLPEESLRRIGAVAAEHGKCDFTLEATITDAEGTVVAETVGLYQLRAR